MVWDGDGEHARFRPLICMPPYLPVSFLHVTPPSVEATRPLGSPSVPEGTSVVAVTPYHVTDAEVAHVSSQKRDAIVSMKKLVDSVTVTYFVVEDVSSGGTKNRRAMNAPGARVTLSVM